ncbi:sulfatase [Cohnella sp.]|uniref:sulfatase n=1 Tax=Cohnella sp. TaxID=1883426 RepID=UPI00356334C0
MKAIVVLLDTLNRRMLQAYNPDTFVKAPNLARLAEKCVVFDQHWAGSLPCMPARRDILTGRPDFLERGWGGLEPFDETLPEKLREGRIFSHIVTDHYHYFGTGGENYCQAFDSWDLHRGQESDPWISRVRPQNPAEEIYGQTRPQYEKNRTVWREEADYPGPRTMQAACRWLEDNREADRFFLMVEAFDPHEPFDTPQTYLDLYGDDYTGPRYTWPRYGRATDSPEAALHLQRRYAAKVTMIDRWLGELLDKMDELGMWDDTLVVLTTDHGFLLGEHGMTGKNVMHVYNEIAHLPLMLHVPGVPAEGRRIGALTQNMDLMPTLLDYFGLDIPSRVRGRSLLPIARGEKKRLRDYALFGMFGMTVNLTDGRYTYLRAPVREDNTPCYAYTAMPTKFKGYYGKEDPAGIETGRFLPYTEYPVFRFPVSREGTPYSLLEHVRESRLYDMDTDYGQQAPIADAGLEAGYAWKLAQAMKDCEAPVEQFERLGLSHK